MENISVTVNILERRYNMTVAVNEEKYIRDAAAMIDAQARMFKKHFQHRDNQDLLAMVALSQVAELNKTKEGLDYKDSQLIDKLQEIDAILENSLHPSQNSL